eukprot:CAMPEP_0113881738 /NCGR_PEP_ID=MMETSP0780_2-20120614/8549_1 /TAXON_ID=652834 /ORGANISM="Palpitomonas bilix" /LENGTH=327 /DNA_ID=CAMNT_0000868641 /DNA_START=157 /DNA_END=1140 /DNA_ORIENTATION=+ /assembly_acc=CAM_ASM_000599
MMFAAPTERFEECYTVHSAAAVAIEAGKDGSDAEATDKIYLPPRALDALVRRQIAYPMLFELSNPSIEGSPTVHCGVLEFVAPEGVAGVPYWLMQNLHLEDGDIINVKSAMLPKGIFVKFRPTTSDFLKIANPRAVLENRLRKFSCLTQGETIKFEFNRKFYSLEVIEVKGNFNHSHTCNNNAVSIIETDIEVDFAAPLDMPVEPEKPKKQKKSLAQLEKEEAMPAFIASGDGETSAAPEEAKPTPTFVGAGYTLRGDRVVGEGSEGGSERSSASEAARAAALRRLGASGSQSGKSNGMILSGPKGKDEQALPESFKAFEGAGYTLK